MYQALPGVIRSFGFRRENTAFKLLALIITSYFFASITYRLGPQKSLGLQEVLVC